MLEISVDFGVPPLCSSSLARPPSCPYRNLQHCAPYWFHSCDPPSCVPSSVTLAFAARSGLAHTSQPMSVGMENWIPSTTGGSASRHEKQLRGITSLWTRTGAAGDKQAANRGGTHAMESEGREWRQPGMNIHAKSQRHTTQTSRASGQQRRRLMSHLDESLQHGHLGKRNWEVDVGCLCASTDV
jgi:hypothetical protein